MSSSPSPVLKARIDDFVAAVAAPGTNERLLFARRVVERRGIDPAAEEGRGRLRRYLEERTAVVGSAVHAPVLHDPATGLAEQITIFRDRGLASDTLLWIDFAIDQALAEHESRGRAAAAQRAPGGDYRSGARLRRQAGRLRFLSPADDSAIRARSTHSGAQGWPPGLVSGSRRST